MKTRIHQAKPAHEVVYQEIVALVHRHADQMTPMEILAIAANMLGKLLAVQDQRRVTPAEAMEVIARNIEEGNAEMIAQLTNTKGNA